MAELDSSALSIMQAVFGMGFLTITIAIWMALTRMPAMKRAGLTFEDGAHTSNLRAKLPSSVQRIGDNYNHLFEAPTLFYATALAIVVAGIADPIHAACAWAFLASRILHSLVQASFNHVPTRIVFFTFSWLALAAMVVRGALSL
jgi:hypothetical protein